MFHLHSTLEIDFSFIIFHYFSHFTISVADLGFPRGGCAKPKGGAPTYYLPNFSRNCMKMKKFWPRGGGGPVPGAPLRSATAYAYPKELESALAF